MSDPIIEIRGLSKKYYIGKKERSNRTFREAIVDIFTAPIRNLKNIRKITKSEGEQDDTIWALKDISLDIQVGEVLGIIGRNGAGKSTLLKILSRITEPTEGEVKLQGRVSSLLEVGTGFHPELTGRENIYLNGTMLGMKKSEINRRFDEIVAFSEIEKFLDTPVKRYSSGMYIRLAFAVAAHLEPEILLVDEILAVGDTAFQKKCLGKMSDVSKEGRTVLFVSHNMGSLRHLCSSGILLNDGHAIYYDNISNAIDSYIQSNTQDKQSLNDILAHNESLGIVLSSIQLVNDEGQEVSAAQVGRPFIFKLNLKIAKPYKRFLASIAITNIEGIRLCTLHSNITGFEEELKSSTEALLCRVSKTPFLPGRYYIHIKLIVENTHTVFNLPFIKEFSVDNGDFYGTGRLPSTEWGGMCLIEHTWGVTS